MISVYSVTVTAIVSHDINLFKEWGIIYIGFIIFTDLVCLYLLIIYMACIYLLIIYMDGSIT